MILRYVKTILILAGFLCQWSKSVSWNLFGVAIFLALIYLVLEEILSKIPELPLKVTAEVIDSPADPANPTLEEKANVRLRFEL
jgi:hypothetical protein